MEHPAYSQLRPITESVGVVLCPNPSYSSLEGTNAYVIKAEGDSRSIVVDPGPEDEGHLNVLHRYAGDVALILLTHRHGDHADGARRFRQLTGAPIRAVDKRYCSSGQEPLTNGERINLDGITPEVEVVLAPGHTADSACFFVHTTPEAAETDGAETDGVEAAEAGGVARDANLEGIITGDTIAGRHTTMISETDGDLGEYMETLKMLDARGKGVRLLPGHGSDLPDITVMTQKYMERREQRLQQVQAALNKLGDDATITDIVDEIYTDVDPVLRHAAEQSTRVTLRYLQKQ